MIEKIEEIEHTTDLCKKEKTICTLWKKCKSATNPESILRMNNTTDKQVA